MQFGLLLLVAGPCFRVGRVIVSRPTRSLFVQSFFVQSLFVQLVRDRRGHIHPRRLPGMPDSPSGSGATPRIWWMPMPPSSKPRAEAAM